jgi:hypothetical protein
MTKRIDVEISISEGQRRAIARDDANRAFGEVFARRGYIVIGTVPGPKYELGAKVNQIFEYETRRAFVITAYTTRRDMEAQMKLLAELNPTWRRREGKTWGAGGTFYRIVPARTVGLGLRARHNLLSS